MSWSTFEIKFSKQLDLITSRYRSRSHDAGLGSLMSGWSSFEYIIQQSNWCAVISPFSLMQSDWRWPRVFGFARGQLTRACECRTTGKHRWASSQRKRPLTSLELHRCGSGNSFSSVDSPQTKAGATTCCKTRKFGGSVDKAAVHAGGQGNRRRNKYCACDSIRVNFTQWLRLQRQNNSILLKTKTPLLHSQQRTPHSRVVRTSPSIAGIRTLRATDQTLSGGCLPVSCP